MILFIDPGQDVLALQLRTQAGDEVAEREVSLRDHRSLNLLESIVDFCRAQRVGLDKLSSIGVAEGKGSFTTLRQVVSVANALKWANPDIQLFSVTARKKMKTHDYLSPKYSGEPNITTSKKRYPQRA